MSSLKAPIDFLSQKKEVTKVSALAGTILSHTGAKCSNLIILQKGVVRVYRPARDGRTITLYHLKEGGSCILTASCIINAQVFPAIAEAEQDVEGLLIPAKAVHEWLISEPLWQQYIFSLLSERMSDLISLVDALAFQYLDNRLATWLLDQSTHVQILNTTHQVIADELASSREVISRMLKKFEQNGLVKLGRGKIEIIDKNRLYNL